MPPLSPFPEVNLTNAPAAEAPIKPVNVVQPLEISFPQETSAPSPQNDDEPLGKQQDLPEKLSPITTVVVSSKEPPEDPKKDAAVEKVKNIGRISKKCQFCQKVQSNKTKEFIWKTKENYFCFV